MDNKLTYYGTATAPRSPTTSSRSIITNTTTSTTSTTTTTTITNTTTTTTTSTVTTSTVTSTTTTTVTTTTITSTSTSTSTTVTTTTTTPHCWGNCSWIPTGNCDPREPPQRGKHSCGETTCFYRSGFCDCNGDGKLTPAQGNPWNGTNYSEPHYSCVSNNKYYLGKDANGNNMFKKPPIVCNDMCNNYNCTYTFHTEPDCKRGNATDHKEATWYPPKCLTDPKPDECQKKHRDACNLDKTACCVGESAEGTEQNCLRSSDLIVRGWGSYFELDYTYKSVTFNGHGNCGFFLYSEEYFTGATGKFNGYYKSQDADKPWNGPSNPSTLCRNFNMTYFHDSTRSLETNDTCWASQTRANQSVLR